MTLTTRQREVMRLICSGHRDKEIADVLKISIHTVREHAGDAVKRLGASNRESAVFLFAVKTKNLRIELPSKERKSLGLVGI